MPQAYSTNDLLGGRYRLERRVGTGGMGVVWAARNLEKETTVAIKVIHGHGRDDTLRKRFVREARAAAAVHHPNVVSVLDVLELPDGGSALVMELLHGGSLADLLRRDGVLSLQDAATVLRAVCAGVGAAHRLGIVHRDLKPENVFVAVDEERRFSLKVLDFGVAKLLSGDLVSALTTAGSMLGTPAYMAPEQARGERTIDARADIWSLGILAYQCLTGVLPTAGDGVARIIRNVLSRPIAPILEVAPSLPGDVAEMVDRMLVRDRADRPADLTKAEEVFARHAQPNGLSQRARASSHVAVHSDRGDAASVSAETVAVPSAEALPPTIAGKYVSLRQIGRGGMGNVYEVEHAHTGERWAMKVLHRAVALDPVTLKRFKTEARVSARLRSPHAVRVIDADVAQELDGAPFIVMELLEGETVADAAQGAQQPPARVVDWLRQVGRVLDKAHALGIVHRDLKPENLFIARHFDDPPMVKILDFGIAKVRDSEHAQQTVSGQIMGTPLYMSPEQAEGLGEVGPGTDVWAVGMIAYNLLAGGDYWEAGSLSTLIAKLISAPIEPPSARGLALGEPFDAWFLRSCDVTA